MPYDELFERVKNSPLLVLDDFGAQASTPWAKEKLDQLLNHRFNNELPTVITTAIPVDELDENIRARFTDPQRCQILVIEDKRALSNNYEWPPEFKLQKSMTFENFDWHRRNLPAEQQENLAEAYRLAFDFAKEPEGWLVFMGVTGCGKTHLASAIVNYRYQAKQPALFVVVPEFLDHLRSTFGPESKVSYDQVFERVKKAPCWFWMISGNSPPLPGHRKNYIRSSITVITPGWLPLLRPAIRWMKLWSESRAPSVPG